MDEIDALGAALLVVGGLVAGVVNTLAGGGSLLTVPLLVLLGLPGTLANGTNRVGILLQCLTATWRFRAAGVFAPRTVLPVLAPIAAGALLGALAISRVADETFERLFGLLMLVLLVPTLRRLPSGEAAPPPKRWGGASSGLAFLAIGVYAGAFQAGVGVPLLLALLHAGHDAVRANAIKVAVIALATLMAIPIFWAGGQIAWLPAGLLGLGFTVGASLGVPLAVRGGERLIRPLLALAVLALAAHMLGLY